MSCGTSVSLPAVSPHDFPVSRWTMLSSSSVWSSIQSRHLPSHSARPSTPTACHAGWAARSRAATASTSAAAVTATLPTTSPVAGHLTTRSVRISLVAVCIPRRYCLFWPRATLFGELPELQPIDSRENRTRRFCATTRSASSAGRRVDMSAAEGAQRLGGLSAEPARVLGGEASIVAETPLARDGACRGPLRVSGEEFLMGTCHAHLTQIGHRRRA